MRNFNIELADTADEQCKMCTMLIQLEAKRYTYLSIHYMTLEIMTLGSNLIFPLVRCSADQL